MIRPDRFPVPISLIVLFGALILSLWPAVFSPVVELRRYGFAAALLIVVGLVLVFIHKTWGAIAELRAEQAKIRAQLVIYQRARLDAQWRAYQAGRDDRDI